MDNLKGRMSVVGNLLQISVDIDSLQDPSRVSVDAKKLREYIRIAHDAVTKEDIDDVIHHLQGGQ